MGRAWERLRIQTMKGYHKRQKIVSYSHEYALKKPTNIWHAVFLHFLLVMHIYF